MRPVSQPLSESPGWRVQGIEVEVAARVVADPCLAMLVGVDGSGLRATGSLAVLVTAEAARGRGALGLAERNRRPVVDQTRLQEAREVVRDEGTVDAGGVADVITGRRRDVLRVERREQVASNLVGAAVVLAVVVRLQVAVEVADTVDRGERDRCWQRSRSRSGRPASGRRPSSVRRRAGASRPGSSDRTGRWSGPCSAEGS